MNRRLFWKLFLIITTGIIVLFWMIDLVTSRTEESMSFIDVEYRKQITAWGLEAERLYLSNDKVALSEWLKSLSEAEQTRVSIASANLTVLFGESLPESYSQGYILGRSVDWKIHLYFKGNPTMEVPFADGQTSFLIKLPNRMRPGLYFSYTWIVLKIILPIIVLALLSFRLYRHIIVPLRQLERATRNFSQGDFNVRVRQLLGNRNDELSDLADTFDQMAVRIGEQVINQRQLIADLSHELRTPLTRLDISAQSLQDGQDVQTNLERIQRESVLIRKLVEDSLAFAWLENERPELQQESLDLTDLLDVLIEDARFEFPDRKLNVNLPSNAEIHNSNHRSLGQALENIIRNALRFTPPDKIVSISMHDKDDHYNIRISDQGPGVPEKYLTAIFQPFFRLDSSRLASGNSFGLGLALAYRQIAAVGGTVKAKNKASGGLEMNVNLPKN